jgi:phosphonate transport system permease protein
MTARAPAATRPDKPKGSLLVPAGLLGALLLTLWSASREFGIGFDPAALFADIGRGREILAEVFQPNFAFVDRTIEPMLETIQMAIVSSTIGCAVALPAAFVASRVTTPGHITFAVSRGALSVIRSLPDLLYALVFVTALSVGPLAGIMALIFFNLGVAAKLLSETVDAVDRGPLEAASASGAAHVEVVRTAVLPQVLPHYVAYSLYVFELNIRASAVIGITGAGGIGNTLNAQMGFFNYENVGLIILEIFFLVLAIEIVSIALRRRLT